MFRHDGVQHHQHHGTGLPPPAGLPAPADLGHSTAGYLLAAYGYALVRVNRLIPRGEHAAVERHLRDAHAAEPLPSCGAACAVGRGWTDRFPAAVGRVAEAG